VTGYLPPEAAGAAPGRGRLAGRRILVVGAGTRPSPELDAPVGNGRAISVLAAREGAAVACADKDKAAAEVTAAMAGAEGAQTVVLRADVSEPEACAQVVAEAAGALGGLDGLVLDVGIGLGRGMAGTTAEQWDAGLRGQHAGAFPGRGSGAAGARRRVVDRVHQLSG
jgi:NAD(P)-dependent dehydrogenase (short-subunit alcohol dehydrogenase family)